MFVLKNIDWLFNYPNGAALYSKTEKMGMSGLFVFNPYYHFYEIYKIILDNYSAVQPPKQLKYAQCANKSPTIG